MSAKKVAKYHPLSDPNITLGPELYAQCAHWIEVHILADRCAEGTKKLPTLPELKHILPAEDYAELVKTVTRLDAEKARAVIYKNRIARERNSAVRNAVYTYHTKLRRENKDNKLFQFYTNRKIVDSFRTYSSSSKPPSQR